MTAYEHIREQFNLARDSEADLVRVDIEELADILAEIDEQRTGKIPHTKHYYYDGDKEYNYVFTCPSCYGLLSVVGSPIEYSDEDIMHTDAVKFTKRHNRFCSECGQKLIWGEEKVNEQE